MKFIDLLNKNKDIEHIVRSLIVHHSKLSVSEIFLNIESEIDFSINDFNKDLELYKAKKPLQYILGYSYFLDLKINVKEGVFIPRPETEALTDEIIMEIDEFFKDQKITIADVCSGSGAIALGLDFHTESKVYGLELSDQALAITKENNTLNKCSVEFVKSDIDAYLIDNNIKVDVLVSNPPYIKPGFNLDTRVIDNEPHMALFDKEKDGMSFYRHILANHKKTTNSKAIIAFEFGFDQKEDMEKLIKDTLGNAKYYFIYDYQNHARGVIILKNK